MEPAANRTWRPAKAGTQAKPANRHRWAIIVGVLLMVALGVVLALLLYLRPRATEPRLLSLALHDPPEGAPAPPWLRQDSVALLDFKWGRKNVGDTSQQRALLLDELDGLGKADPKQPLVIYLAGYVAVRPDDGAPCLLPNDANLDRPSTWVPLARVLDSVRQCPCPQKLLLIDVMRPPLVPESGLLRSDVADRVWPLLEAAADDHLGILAACSRGQTSHASEYLGRSVFSYFVTQGLRGKAREGRDREGPGTYVTVKMLAAYVTEKVDRWAWDNLDARQTPVLLPREKDDQGNYRYGGPEFPLLQAGKDEDEADGLSSSYPDWLLEGWQTRDRWWAERVHWQSPALMREVETTLLRAERRWRAGQKEEGVRADLRDQLDRLRREVDRLRKEQREKAPLRDEAPTSLEQLLAKKPHLPRPDDKEFAKQVEEVRKLLTLAAEVRDPKKDKAGQDRIDQGVEALLTKTFKDKPLHLALTVCAALEGYVASPDAVLLAMRLLRDGKAEPYESQSLDDLRVLKLLEQRAMAAKRDFWSGEVARLAYETDREALRTRTVAERARPWLEERLKRAEAQATGAEKLLQPEGSWDRNARKPFEAALKERQEINYLLREVEDAQACRDEAFVRLPDYVAALEIEPKNAPAHAEAVAAALNLRRLLLDVPPEGDQRKARLDQILPKRASLRQGPNSLHTLSRPLEPKRLEAILALRGGPRSADWKECRLLLATAWPTAVQRAGLWNSYVKMAAARAREGGRAGFFTWDERAEKAARKELIERDRRRARGVILALEMDLALHPEKKVDLAGLKAALDEWSQSPEDARRWKKFAGLLADAMKLAAETKN
jgi:hypothetical protein